MIGTLINTGAIVLGTLIGLLLKKALPKDIDKPIVYFVGGVPETFVINTGETDETAVIVYLKKKFAAQLADMVKYADEKHQTAIIGFSLDSSGVLSIHVRSFDLVTRTAGKEDHRIVLDSFKNLFEFSAGSNSGWMYRVNGKFPNYGCSLYDVKSGDVIEWLYTCDLGHDIGGSNYSK